MKAGEKESEAIIDFIKANDDFSIFYHLDGDGITSAAILAQAIEKLGKRLHGVRPTNYEDFENGINLSDFSDTIVICDLQVLESYIPELKAKNLCVIDHHEVINHAGIIYINPKMWGDLTYTPCALLTYRLFEKFVPESDWVSAIGLVSDAGGKENDKWLREVAGKYGVKLKDDEYLYDNEFGLVASMLNSMTLQYGREGADEALGILLQTRSLNELLANQKLVSANNNAKKEVYRLREDFENKKEAYGDLIYFFDVPSIKKRYSSSVITPLSMEKGYYGKILVFMTRVNSDTMRVNIRANGLDVKLPHALRGIFTKIKGNGGGHDPAAGASIRPQDKDKFKTLFAEEIRKQLDKKL